MFVKVFHPMKITCVVATLALGSRPRQGLTKAQAKSEAWESHLMLPGGWKYGKVGELNFHTPKWTPTLGVKVPMDSQIFKKWLQEPIKFKNSLYH